MATSMYSLYDDGGSLYAQGECKYVCDLLGISRDAVHYAAKSGKRVKGYRIESKPLGEMKFALWEGKQVVFEGDARRISDYLRVHGAEKYTPPNVYRSCYGKFLVANRYKITPASADMKRSAFKGRVEKEAENVIWHLDFYGNTLICGKDKDAVLDIVKERKDIDYRKVSDGGKKYHYYIEVNR